MSALGEPMARLLSYGIAAVEPGMLGLVPSLPCHSMEQTDWKLGDMKHIVDE